MKDDTAIRGLRFGADVQEPSRRVDAASLADRYDFAPVLRPEASPLVDASGVAMDGTLGGCADVARFLAETGGMVGAPLFIGYASCANLAQDGMMQAGVETLADDMVREWLDVHCTDADRAKGITEYIQRLRLRRLFRDAASMVGYFGVCRMFIDTGTRDPEELKTPLTPYADKVGRGMLRGFIPIDPILMYPGVYNAADPLSPRFYRPQTWFALGREIHASRFLHFVQHEPPLILKPSYNFGGIPAVQLALDYLLHFTETREAAARLLKKFSLTAFKSNMQGILYGDDESDIHKRVKYLAQNRDNDGILLVDMEDEDIIQINTPLSGTIDIVRQALEMLAAIWRMPVTKFLGISPGGMNATGESDMRNWYDYVQGQQRKMYDPALDTALRVIQLSLYGDIDPGCAWAWNPLWTPTDAEIATINKAKADADAVLLANGTISQEESRARLAADPMSGYAGIDPDAVPEPPAEPLYEEVVA